MGLNGSNHSRSFAPNILRTALALAAFGLFVVGLALPSSQPAVAAAGINKTINFQGRLLTAAGAVVADGNYNMRFKVYQDGAGTAAFNGGTSGAPIGLKWTEEYKNSLSEGVVVKNGYYSVALGTYCAFSGSACTGGQTQGANVAVDWNQDTLWLSMDVGGTTAGAITYDGELLPMRRMSSAVYALQAGSCTSCVLQAPTSTAQNTIAPTTASVVALTVSATSGTAAQALVVNQTQAADALSVNLTAGSQTNGILVNHTSAGTLTNGLNITSSAGAITADIKLQQAETIDNATNGTVNVAADSGALTLKLTGTAATIQNSAGVLTLTGAAGANIASAAATNKVLSVTGAAAQTADLLELQNSSSAVQSSFSNSGDLTVGNAANVSGAARLFSDGFESNNLDLWDSSTVLGGSSAPAPSAIQQRTGKYSSVFAVSSGQTYETKNIGTQTTVMARGYIYVASASSVLRLLGFDDGTNSYSIIRSATNTVQYFTTVGNITTVSAVPWSSGSWHEVEVDLTAGAGTGTVTVYFDGTSALTATSQTIGNLTHFDIGDSAPAGSAHVGTFYVDDVSADTVRPGDSANLFVADSLHVSGTATISNNLSADGGITGTGVIQLNASGAGATTIGSSAGGVVSIQGGAGGSTLNDTSGNLTLSTTTAGTLAVASAGALNLSSGGANNITLTTANAGAGTIVKTTTNSTTGFQIQNSGSAWLLAADTTRMALVVNSASAATATMTVRADSTGTTTTAVTAAGSSAFVVPNDVTSITIKAWGAGGAGGNGNNTASGQGGGGGGGGYVTSTIAVTPGESLTVLVGSGAAAPGAVASRGGSGGGFSAVQRSSTYLIQAGGGGGAGGSRGATSGGSGGGGGGANGGSNGTAGGSTGGGAGVGGGSGGTGGIARAGGVAGGTGAANAGGAGGGAITSCATAPGTTSAGGTGGAGKGGITATCDNGGGGGGGAVGGGGGGSATTTPMGGGAGGGGSDTTSGYGIGETVGGNGGLGAGGTAGNSSDSDFTGSCTANSGQGGTGNINTGATAGNQGCVVLKYNTNVISAQTSGGTDLFRLGGDGTAVFKDNTDTTQSFAVQDAAGNNELSVDTTGDQVIVGTGSAGESTPKLLVLDSTSTAEASVNSGVGVSGAMYYDSGVGSFVCGNDSQWVGCGGGLVASTVYDNGATGSGGYYAFAGGHITGAGVDFGHDYTIPFNDCTPGVVYKVHAAGWYQSGTSAATMNLQWYVDSAETSHAGIAITATPNNTVYGWTADMNVQCDAVNAAMMYGYATFGGSSTASGSLQQFGPNGQGALNSSFGNTITNNNPAGSTIGFGVGFSAGLGGTGAGAYLKELEVEREAPP